jgi:tetratricopeptide (TPR) repeat protein
MAGWIVAAVAAQVAGVAGPAVPLQAQFEQATAALDAGKWAEAEAAFAAIGMRANVSGRTKGVALLRRGRALSSLGRQDEAADALRRGLQLTPRTDATLADDRVTAMTLLGTIEVNNYDYAAARAAFELALLEANDPADRLRILLPLAQATTFSDSDAALRYTDEAIRLTPLDDRRFQARAHDRKGRVLLNHGDLEGARVELETALSLLGGLTAQTDLDDVVVRSDLATALLLMKRTVRARELLAMTGAGRMSGEGFGAPARFDLPSCGPDLQPDDIAVVEFGVADSGEVMFAHPVYGSRRGMDVAEYARAVQRWAWRPEDLKNVSPFFRALTRVELRCSTADQRPSVRRELVDRTLAWLTERGVTLPEDPGRISLQALRANAAKRDENPLSHLFALMALARTPLATYRERRAAAEEAVALGRERGMPVQGMTFLMIIRAQAAARESRSRQKLIDGYRAILADPEVSADAMSADVVRLELADSLTKNEAAAIEQLLMAVANDARLQQRDPLRTGARLRLATLQAGMGRLDLAREAFAVSGLSAQQCALVDAKPDMKRSGMGTSMYPATASLWMTSGWTRAEFDLTADGKTLNRRVVAAYPPFVFSTAVQKGLEDARFTQTYRPEGSLGCGGMEMTVRFQMPH